MQDFAIFFYIYMPFIMPFLALLFLLILMAGIPLISKEDIPFLSQMRQDNQKEYKKVLSSLKDGDETRKIIPTYSNIKLNGSEPTDTPFIICNYNDKTFYGELHFSASYQGETKKVTKRFETKAKSTPYIGYFNKYELIGLLPDAEKPFQEQWDKMEFSTEIKGKFFD